MAYEMIVPEAYLPDIAKRLEDFPVPFQQDIFLLECEVDGTMGIDDILLKTENVAVSAELVLKRETDNTENDLAIRVENQDGEKLGYVPGSDNTILARLMDAGKILTAKVVSKGLENHWLNLRISIVMKDL